MAVHSLKIEVTKYICSLSRIFKRACQSKQSHNLITKYLQKIFTSVSGEDPYDQMNFEDIKRHVCFNMSTLEIPETFPPLIKEILMHCWIYDAERRPTFDNLLTAFEKVKAENSLLEQKSLIEIDECFALKKPEREHSQTMWAYFFITSSSRDHKNLYFSQEAFIPNVMPLEP